MGSTSFKLSAEPPALGRMTSREQLLTSIPWLNNGGPTQTHALLAGSLAINAGANRVRTHAVDAAQHHT